VLTTPFARMAPGADLLELLEGQGFETVALSPRGQGTLAQATRARRSAVVLGAEGPGLAEDLLARAKTVRIPMADGFDSLNVAVTAGVVLHHLAFVARRNN
jgi:tRNA G18 (ribose-2'-O)-methylase SpoU